ncbi:MAG: MarR family winged helix-turn-helix transcriptional regulator, partial [Bacillota bacterium]
MGQIKGLFALAKSGGATIGRLAERLGVGEPTASLLVDRLVRQGWVVRGEDPEDRRRTIASLSKEGTDL